MPTDFTPLTSLFGGALIGAAAVMLMASLGRIMGATGVLAGVLVPASRDELAWRLALLAGMVSGPVALWLASGSMPVVQVPVSPLSLLLGGFLVGLGVTFGGGCTSGHGVCGLARMSSRSIVATLVFMAATASTVFVIRHGLGG